MRQQEGLYNPAFEHDACGMGFIAHIKGKKSHQMIDDVLTILEHMEHRGACGCEANTGDGAGILIQIPHDFFYEECLSLKIKLPNYGDYGVAMLFLPKDAENREECKTKIEQVAEKLKLKLLGYRKVRCNPDGIGLSALSVEPHVEQLFIAKPENITDTIDFERKLYVFRNYVSKLVKNSVEFAPNNDFYICSCSSKTIVYKGQLMTMQVRSYYTELSDKRLISGFGLAHSRFATNTFPAWKLAHPYRYIAHNGEINTVQGNVNWFKAGEKNLFSPYFTEEELELLSPIIPEGQSDSACLDNIVELLRLSGRSLPQAMMMLIPEAWDNDPNMPEFKKNFYEYYTSVMEAWDGPASIAFTDGDIVGATLDRNGLRPSRYVITSDHRVILASEAGVLKIAADKIVKRGKLEPGKIFVVDLHKGEILSDESVKETVCKTLPYGKWLKKHKIRIKDLPEPRVEFTDLSSEQIHKYQSALGYTKEELETIILPMARDGKEPIGSMGSDIPLAVLSDEPQHLSSYFKQLFAQVTNPPIDPIREKTVMSLSMYVGGNGNLLTDEEYTCHTLALPHPLLNNHELEKIRSIDTGRFQAKTINTYFRADGKPGSMEKALKRLCNYAMDAVEDGFEVIILSDRSIDSEHAAIPSLLATSTVHHHLIKNGCRGKVGIIVEAGDVWEVHHFACLIGFGATAVNPYLALASIKELLKIGRIDSKYTYDALAKNYTKAINDGLLKVISKIGISTLQSYQGAQIFEILGINNNVVNKYFTGAVSRIGGLDLDDIAHESLLKHRLAYEQNIKLLPVGGVYQWKQRGEAHLFSPQAIHNLQYSTRMGDYSTFKKYSSIINNQAEKACTLRSLLNIDSTRPAISIDEVEPIENILKRFSSGAMSFGSISHEAHSTLAIAMNRIGAKSNSGEGGEDDSRYALLANGDSQKSAIRQVASGRFGVTSYYLSNAKELQIKMAQGAKPGEGGQLPGDKVDDWIAKVRHSTPGVGLISPPPHHDIYSIEDLAQLIFDLKNSNPSARVSVKLVSKTGVGTIASGVAKAHADAILISGFDGGTGASPMSSIRHAGLPWELGLSETHQTLVLNDLRSRVVVQTDGQLRTGLDLVIATLLGAEEWCIATAALVVEGCVMMRKCHLNTCPVGVATQDPELRKRFTGKPEHVVNFFTFLAMEMRELMADLGFRSVNEMVGQVEYLKTKKDIQHWKHQKIDLSAMLYRNQQKSSSALFKNEEQDHGIDNILDRKLIQQASQSLQKGTPVSIECEVENTDRSIGTMLSHEISKAYGATGLTDDTIKLKFHGSAGQSFGAFATKGVTLELEGEGNDYVGKGLCGAKIIIYPENNCSYASQENIVIGNVALYGATSGVAYIKGRAGERFGVRNSGAIAVIEGLGAHGCEYMTGGAVVVLGNIGKNFAAGMSGGIAYIYHPEKESLSPNFNMESIDLEDLNNNDLGPLKQLIENHFKYTRSVVANFILNDWENQQQNFIKVFPKEYKSVLEAKKLTHQIVL